MLGFQRFLDNHEYRTTVPVQSLFFEVTVHRAPIIEEHSKELLVKDIVAWGSKRPSLEETLAACQRIIVRREELARALVSAGGSPHAISDHESTLQEEDPMGMEAFKAVMAAEGDGLVAKMENLCERGTSVLFTRPPIEDYIPPHDEVNVVDPPQQPTPLTIAMLRDHRTRNMPSTKMHFGISLGTIMRRSQLRQQGHHMGSPKSPRLSPRSNNGGAEGGNGTNNEVSDAVEMIESSADGNGLVSFDNGASDLLKYAFVGHEVILASIDNVAENELRSKPSLVHEHTCHVDATHVYTFTVTVTDKDPNKVDVSASFTAGGAVGRTVRTAMMVKMFANMLKSTLRASRRFEQGALQAQAQEERDKQVMLKQAIMNRMQRQYRATSGDGRGGAYGNPMMPKPWLGDNGAKSLDFTPPPEYEGTMRLHVFGVIETAFNIPQDSLFVRYRFLLPDGCKEDGEINFKSGLPKSLCGPVTSQLAWASRIRDEDFIYRTMHTFNLPLELHASLPINSTTPIRLLMSFYSKGSGGDYFQTVEGYGQQTIPMFAGQYNFEVLLWRPKPTAYEYLKSVFIGGTPRLADEEDMAIPAHVMDGYASRAGLQTESTGYVRLNFNIVSHMRPEETEDERLKKKAAVKVR